MMFISLFNTLFKFISRNPWLAWLWSFAILVACTWPGKDIPEAPVTGFDKLVHAGLFAVWIVLWLAPYPKKKLFFVVAGVIYGVSLEFYQQLLPFDRTFDWWDAVADAAGVLIGFAFKSLVVDRYLQRLY